MPFSHLKDDCSLRSPRRLCRDAYRRVLFMQSPLADLCGVARECAKHGKLLGACTRGHRRRAAGEMHHGRAQHTHGQLWCHCRHPKHLWRGFHMPIFCTPREAQSSYEDAHQVRGVCTSAACCGCKHDDVDSDGWERGRHDQRHAADHVAVSERADTVQVWHCQWLCVCMPHRCMFQAAVFNCVLWYILHPCAACTCPW